MFVVDRLLFERMLVVGALLGGWEGRGEGRDLLILFVVVSVVDRFVAVG